MERRASDLVGVIVEIKIIMFNFRRVHPFSGR
jgi:hypothetical protein